MRIPAKKEEKTIEECLSRFGANIDQLLIKASETRNELHLRLNAIKDQEVQAFERGAGAIEEFKNGLDKAWEDLNLAWNEIVEGADRAAKRLSSEPAESNCEAQKIGVREERLAKYDCYFCDNCREYVYDEFAGDSKRGIAPETMVDCLPESWRCPSCGSTSQALRAVILFDDFSDKDFAIKEHFE